MENEAVEAQATEGESTEQPVEQDNTVEPETLYANKYKSISELEKGYNNLQSKLGKFTGAPEAYETNEGVEISEDNPLFGKLQELGKEIGLNNDGFNALVQMYNDSMEEQQAIYDEQAKEEMAKLGDNANERIQNIADWTKANLSEAEQAVVDRISTDAETVQFIESMIARSKPQGVAQDNQVANAQKYDKDKLRDMQLATDKNGNRLMSVDRNYYNKVMGLMEQYG